MYPYLFGLQDIFGIEGLSLNMYGLCIGLGVIACLLFLRFAGKKLNLPQKFLDFVEWNAIIAIVCGLLSGMLFQAFYDFIETGHFDLSKDHITFIGGLIGGVAIFLLIYFLYGRKKYGAYLMRLLPIAACCIMVAHAFGRIGCLCFGCCYGKTFTTQTFGTIYISNPASPAYGKWVYPTQIYESLFLFISFGICAYLTIAKKYKYTMNIYLIAYGIFRFSIEFIRGDDRGSLIKGISLYPSQIWSIVMVLIGVAFYFVMPYIVKKYGIDFDAPLPEEKIEEQSQNEDYSD